MNIDTNVNKQSPSPAVLDAFGFDVNEVSLPSDVIAPGFENETGVRYYATNGGGWTGNVIRIKF